MNYPIDEIKKAIQSVINKYKNRPEYQPTNLIIQPIKGHFSIKCLGPHHVANSYDIGLAIGNEFLIDYKPITGGTEVIVKRRH